MSAEKSCSLQDFATEEVLSNNDNIFGPTLAFPTSPLVTREILGDDVELFDLNDMVYADTWENVHMGNSDLDFGEVALDEEGDVQSSCLNEMDVNSNISMPNNHEPVLSHSSKEKQLKKSHDHNSRNDVKSSDKGRSLKLQQGASTNKSVASEPSPVGSTSDDFVIDEVSVIPSKRSYALGDSNSKNAQAARYNRFKKKQYVAGLECSVQSLKTENCNLREEAEINRKRVKKLQEEVAYLKSVIVNQSTLSSVLGSVLKTPGIRLTTSFDFGSGKSEEFNSEEIQNGKLKQVELKKSFHLEDQVASSSRLTHRALRSSSRKGRVAETAPSEESLPKVPYKKQRINPPSVQTSSSVSEQQTLQCLAEADTFVSVTDSDDESSGSSWIDRASESDTDAGVCLHVSGKRVSLEFCSSCSRNAKTHALLDHCYIKEQPL